MKCANSAKNDISKDICFVRDHLGLQGTTAMSSKRPEPALMNKAAAKKSRRGRKSKTTKSRRKAGKKSSANKNKAKKKTTSKRSVKGKRANENAKPPLTLQDVLSSKMDGRRPSKNVSSTIVDLSDVGPSSSMFSSRGSRVHRRSRASIPRSGGLDGSRVQVLAPKGHTFTQGEEDSLVNVGAGAEYEEGGAVTGPGNSITWEGIGVQGGV